jgi:hypothetical protein
MCVENFLCGKVSQGSKLIAAMCTIQNVISVTRVNLLFKLKKELLRLHDQIMIYDNHKGDVMV